MKSHRNSEVWMPDIRRLGTAFYAMKLNPQYIIYRERSYDAANDFCNTAVDILKNEMFPHPINKDECLLDWHKIFAVHILAFLKNRIYDERDNKIGMGIADMLANECFCLLLLKTMARAWHESAGRDGTLLIPEDYELCLIKIFHKYKRSGLLNVRDTTFIYALANIAYLAERCFFVDNGQKVR